MLRRDVWSVFFFSKSLDIISFYYLSPLTQNCLSFLASVCLCLFTGFFKQRNYKKKRILMMIFVIFTTCLHCNKGFALTLEVMAEVFSTPSYFLSDKIQYMGFDSFLSICTGAIKQLNFNLINFILCNCFTALACLSQ